LVRVWAGGLREKGSVNPWGYVSEEPVRTMWVGGTGEESGPGIVFAASATNTIAGRRVPRDADDK
jgi:hypothetical protein